MFNSYLEESPCRYYTYTWKLIREQTTDRVNIFNLTVILNSVLHLLFSRRSKYGTSAIFILGQELLL